MTKIGSNHINHLNICLVYVVDVIERIEWKSFHFNIFLEFLQNSFVSVQRINEHGQDL
jgi:hypothetical protein